MKKVEKMSNRELRVELVANRRLLTLARCPDVACLLGTVTGKQRGRGTWENFECQWCRERNELIGE